MASSTEKKKKAQMIVKEKTDFYIHFAIYIIVNLFIIIQWWWITEGEGFPWFITTLAGWGIGILAHFIVTYMKVKEVQKMP
jgi:hypothetical protein